MRHSKALYSHDLFQVEDEYEIIRIPSGKLTVCYGKSPWIVGSPMNSMVFFHSFLLTFTRGYIQIQHHGVWGFVIYLAYHSLSDPESEGTI
jgi:hypothetical protein